MKGSAACFLCAAVLIAAVIGSPIDKPKKNLKKYLYKKQGAVGDLPLPLKSKTSNYPAPSSKLRGEKSLPPIVVITGTSDDDPAGISEGQKPEGIYNFFNKISRAFARDGKGEHDMEHGDLLGNDQMSPFGSQKPTAFPSAPLPDHPMNDEGGQSGERDDEDSGSEEEDNEEDDNGDEPDNEDQDEDDNDNEEAADDLVNIDGILPAKVKKNKKPKDPEPVSQEDTAQASSETEKKKPGNDKESKEKGEEEQEDESEEEEESDDIPEDVPPFIRQAMIEEHKKKQQEQAQGGGRPGGPQQQGQQGPGGRPGYGEGPQQQYGRPPQKTGGFLSSLFS